MISLDDPSGTSDGASVKAAARAEWNAVRDRWRREGNPDAPAFLAAHPDLAADRDLVREAAYEEYCLRREAGQAVDRDAFCARFPRFRSEIRRTLDVHSEVVRHLPQLEEALPPDWPETGDEVLGFRLVKELGRGGFGRVFFARQPRMGNRLVVVKLSCDGAVEANTLGPLAHPNIVAVYSSELDPVTGLTVVCIPYQGQATVNQVLRRLFRDGSRPLSARDLLEAVQAPAEEPVAEPGKPSPALAGSAYPRAVMHLGLQLADALAYLHQQGIAHRDLKPANLLLTPVGNVVLLDFNLASTPDDETARIVGTLPYMAPEQLAAAQGPPPAALAAGEGRADLYALGVILYELLTGRHPFGPLPEGAEEAELRQLLLRRQRRRPAPLRALCKQVRPEFARLVEQCLAREPAARPGSAAEVATVLRRMLAPSPWLRRLLRGAAAAAAVALACTAWRAAGTAPAPAVAGPPEVDARDLLQKGQAAYEERDYPTALPLLSRATLWLRRGRFKTGSNTA